MGDIQGKFIIPSYQRGYRWGESEVTRLLDDIYANGEKNYCLQPVVVKRDEKERFELIDGQQRLTTLFILFRFDELKQENSLNDIWRKIQQTFLILKDWYEDHDLYHKIGYLIASGFLSLSRIYELSQGKTKDEFRTLLDDHIRRSVDIPGDYTELSYDDPNDRKRISTLLLLFNVESVRKIDEQTQRFPFDQFKTGNNNMVKTPYLFSVMQTKTYWSSNTYVPYLKAADEPHLSKDSMGQRLVYDSRGCYIICENAAYVLKKIEDDSVLSTVEIAQTQDGIDTEDRVVKLEAYVKTLI